ncbi:MAG TPA: SGNH/GDSL hydrolase family protein [Opitutus sp.]|nr:SGNH/GDSL hydrolase family protein [Opitutus sp.]
MKPKPFARCFFAAALSFISSMSAAAESANAARVMPANAREIGYEGRTVDGPNGAVRMGFPGVTVHLRFRGAGISLRADAPKVGADFDVSLDGAAPTLLELKQGERIYPLVEQAAAGEHTLTLTRRTESWQGVCTLVDFELGPGAALLSGPELPARKLMFIGDSVTCGEYAAWKPGDPVDNLPIFTNARISYGMVLARRLGAQCELVSYGGRGVIRDWQGIRKTNNAPEFYELAMPDEPAARWDHHRYVPDAIGIQLGTNDFGSGVPEETEFVTAYVEFLRKIRRDAPKAWIVIMDSPILNDDAGGPRHSLLHAYVEEVARTVRDERVVVASIRHYPGVPHNGHPTGAEHQAMADELEPVFRRVLGW